MGLRRYDRPISIGDGVFWVGYHDAETNVHCNPYLIVEGDQAALIDAGSRADFPVVLTKVLQTGIDPHQIVRLIYQHYDPDLCGSMMNMLDVCDNPELKIITETKQVPFVYFYVDKDRYHLIQSIDEIGFHVSLNGRSLRFATTPYAHSAGSFVTFDEKTRTLFSSDLFGSLSRQWALTLTLSPECRDCTDYLSCPLKKPYCPLPDIIEFHRRIMPSNQALANAMRIIRRMSPKILAPQHGSIITEPQDIQFLIDTLENLTQVGIDGIMPGMAG